MKKSLKVVPLFLLALYYFFINSNDKISFGYKIIALGIIFLLSTFIIYKKVMAKEQSKNSLIVLAIFVLISIAIGLYSYMNV